MKQNDTAFILVCSGMSMVPAEIYHDYLRLSRNLVGGYHAHPSIRVVISWHDIIISCCVWFEAKG